MTSRFLTVAEVAAELGLDADGTVRLIRQTGTPGTRRVEGPSWLVDAIDLTTGGR